MADSEVTSRVTVLSEKDKRSMFSSVTELPSVPTTVNLLFRPRNLIMGIGVGKDDLVDPVAAVDSVLAAGGIEAVLSFQPGQDVVE